MIVPTYDEISAWLCRHIAMDAEGKPKSWITVNGNHIPVFEGETKKESVKNFLGKARRSDVIKKIQ